MIRASRCFLIAITVWWHCHAAWAQFTRIINAPPTVVGNNSSLSSNTQLNVRNGGSVGTWLKAGSSSGSSHNVEVNISGGAIGQYFHAYRGSRINVSGGTIGSLYAESGSYLNITGGSIGLYAYAGSNIDMSGGRISHHVTVNSGSSFDIFGGEFRLDGVLIGGLATPGSSVQLNVPDDAVLSGTLADGTAFLFTDIFGDTFVDGTLTLRAAALPAIGPLQITVPGSPAPKTIRGGQTLVVNSGGIVADNFHAAWGSTIQINGGQIGSQFEAVGADVTLTTGAINHFLALTGSEFNIAGGTVGKNSRALKGSQVNITGGLVDTNFQAHDGSLVNVAGGTIGNGFISLDGSHVNISGGIFGEGFRAEVGSEVDISGGSFGIGFKAYSGSDVNLTGGDFYLDGVAVPGLESLGNTVSLDVPEGSWLTGTLDDGSFVSLSSFDGDLVASGTLKLTSGTPPATVPALITIPSDAAPAQIRKGQTLVLADSGVVPNGFIAGPGSVLQMTGGQMGWDVDAIGSQVTISGGTVSHSFNAFAGSEVNITGGSIGAIFEAFNKSVVNISGGTIGKNFQAHQGSEVNISGGMFEEDIRVDGATVNLTGGNINDNNGTFGPLIVDNGSEVNYSGGSLGDATRVSSGNTFNIYGAEFRVDGELIDGLETIGATATFNLPAGAILSGTLANGTPLAFSSLDYDSFADGTIVLNTAALAPLGPALINVPTDQAPAGVRGGQTLVVSDGGILARNFNAGRGSNVQITGGDVGTNFEAVGTHVSISGGTVGRDFDAYSGSVVDMSGGSVDLLFTLTDGSVLNLSGGEIGEHLTANSGSTVNISGGYVGRDFYANPGSVVNITGGTIGIFMRAYSEVNISGGSIPESLLAYAGSEVNVTGGTAFISAQSGSDINVSGGFVGIGALAGSDVRLSGGALNNLSSSALSHVKISGGDFRLDGVPIAGLETIGSALPLNVPSGAVFSGTLADGTPFSLSSLEFNTLADGSLTLEAADIATGPALISVPDDPAPYGVHEGQTLVLIDGGSLTENFNAGWGSIVELTGGQVGNGFDSIGARVDITGGAIGRDFNAFVGSETNISGGSVGTNFRAFTGSVVNVSGGNVGSYFEAKSGSSVNISGGIVGQNMKAEGGSQVTITGGTVGPNLRAEGGSQVTISGGTVGPLFDALGGSIVTLMDGTIGSQFEALSGSVVNVRGGTLGISSRAHSGAVVNVSGGTVATGFEAMGGSVVNISGGSIASSFLARGGSQVNISGGVIDNDFNALANSQVNLFGTQFLLNNVDITSSLANNVPLTITDRNVSLTGILADGTPFSFDLNSMSIANADLFDIGALLAVNLVVPGDFNFDGDVDGRDFLTWQRDPSVGDLADWQTNYGTTSLTAAGHAVPEPAAIVLLLSMIGFWALLRTR